MKPITARFSPYALAFIVVVVAASLSASTMTLSLPQLQGASGSTINVPIDVAGAEKVGALQFEVLYDTSVLTAESARAGALATDALVEVKTDKPGRLFIALVTTNSISGSGTVATASFKVIGAPGAATPLEPTAAQAWEGITHREVLINPVIGQFTVIEPGFPWLWIVVGLAVLVILLLIVTRRKSKTRAAKA